MNIEDENEKLNNMIQYCVNRFIIMYGPCNVLEPEIGSETLQYITLKLVKCFNEIKTMIIMDEFIKDIKTKLKETNESIQTIEANT